MIEMMDTREPNIVAFRAKGTLDDNDVSQVVGALDVAVKRHEDVRMVADMTRLDDVTMKAMFKDLSAGMKRLDQLSHFDKVAVIGSQDWLETAAKAEDLLIPGLDVQTFSPEQGDEARQWARA